MPRRNRAQQLTSIKLAGDEVSFLSDFRGILAGRHENRFKASLPNVCLRPLGISFLAAAASYSQGNVLVFKDHLQKIVSSRATLDDTL